MVSPKPRRRILANIAPGLARKPSGDRVFKISFQQNLRRPPRDGQCHFVCSFSSSATRELQFVDSEKNKKNDAATPVVARRGFCEQDEVQDTGRELRPIGEKTLSV